MKEKFLKVCMKRKQIFKVLFSAKFVFFVLISERYCYSGVLSIHKTGETSVKASFRLIQVHFRTGFILELNNCKEAVIANLIDCEALCWECLTCISNATKIPLHYVVTFNYEHLILMRHKIALTQGHVT